MKTKKLTEKQCIEIIKKIINEKKSIREMAKEIGISKSCLHSSLNNAKIYLDQQTLEEYNNLLKQNKIEMSEKGVRARGRC